MGEWRRAKFLEAPVRIIDGDRGVNYPKKTEFLPEGYCLFLNAGNVTSTGFDFSDCSFISLDRDKALGKGKLERNDSVLTTRGTVGNVAFFDNSVPFDLIRINSGMVIFRPEEDHLLPSFLYQFLRSSLFGDQVKALTTGSAQPQLPIRDINRIEIPLPPLPEQRAIASVLSALDDKIELNRRMNATLELQARALFADWFTHFGPTRAKAAGEAPYLAPKIWSLFPDRLDENGLPEGWEEKPLGEVVEPRKGRNITKKTVVEGHVPVVAGGLKPAYFHNTSNVIGPVITASASGANAGFIRLYNQDIWASDCSFISRDQTDHLFSIYALLSSRQDEIYTMQQGAAQPHIYPSDLKRLVITDAPKPIWQNLETLLTPMFELVAKNELESRTLAQTRDLLLPRLMSGQLRVREAEGIVEETN